MSETDSDTSEPLKNEEVEKASDDAAAGNPIPPDKIKEFLDRVVETIRRQRVPRGGGGSGDDGDGGGDGGGGDGEGGGENGGDECQPGTYDPDEEGSGGDENDRRIPDVTPLGQLTGFLTTIFKDSCEGFEWNEFPNIEITAVGHVEDVTTSSDGYTTVDMTLTSVTVTDKDSGASSSYTGENAGDAGAIRVEMSCPVGKKKKKDMDPCDYYSVTGELKFDNDEPGFFEVHPHDPEEVKKLETVPVDPGGGAVYEPPRPRQKEEPELVAPLEDRRGVLVVEPPIAPGSGVAPSEGLSDVSTHAGEPEQSGPASPAIGEGERA